MQEPESTADSKQQLDPIPDTPIVPETSPTVQTTKLQHLESHPIVTNAVVTLFGFGLAALVSWFTLQNSLAPFERQRAEQFLLDTELEVQQSPFSLAGSREISIGVKLKNHGYSQIPLDSIQVVIKEGKLTSEALNRFTRTTVVYPEKQVDGIRVIPVHHTNSDISWTQVAEITEPTEGILPVDGQSKYWFKFVLQSISTQIDYGVDPMPAERMRWYHAQVQIKPRDKDVRQYNYYFSRDLLVTIVNETAKRITLE